MSRSSWVSSTNGYSRPFTSPGRGGRVVTDTEIQIWGQVLLSSATTVLFPTPEGPESTVSRECTVVATAALPEREGLGSRLPCGSDIGTELLLKRGTLVGTQPAHTTRFGDAEPFHDLLCPDLTHAGQGLKQSRDLHLSNHVISRAFLDDIRQVRVPALDADLSFGALFSSSGGRLHCPPTPFTARGCKRPPVAPRASSAH